MTVADLIRLSLRTLGVLAAAETTSAAEEADAFQVLNDMLDSWASERLTLFSTLRSAYTFTPNLNPHTLGPGGTFDTTRPVRIDRASVVPVSSTGTERPLRMLSDAEWQDQQGKQTAGIPMSMWVQMAYPLISLFFHPVPVTTDGLVLYSWQQLGRFASTSDTVDLPPGYARMLRYNLAKELAPEFGLTLSAEAQEIATDSKGNLKRLNAQPSYLRSDPALLWGGGRFNLISGDR